MLHRSAIERYQKLKRVFCRLMNNFNRDDLDDFVQTANSLKDWIKRDQTLLPEQKEHLERFIDPRHTDWQICNQLANQLKHADPDSKPRRRKSSALDAPKVTNVQIKEGAPGFIVPSKPGVTIQAKPGGGFVLLNQRIYGAGEEILIEYGGMSESALAFVYRVFSHFHYIFEIAPVPVDKRNLPEMLDILKDC